MTVGQRGVLYSWGVGGSVAPLAHAEVIKHQDAGFLGLQDEGGVLSFDGETGELRSERAGSPGSGERVSFTGPCIVVAQPGDSGTVRRYEWVNRV
jgi:hypothetical protein